MRRHSVRLAVTAVALLAVAAPAAALDLHRLWDEDCSGCHGHSAAFTRSQLRVVDGVLRGAQSQREVRAFLDRHGGLPSGTADAVHDMLRAQAGRTAEFQTRCGICHVNAAQLARDALVSRDGVLLGRYTGRPVAAFLHRHGRLDQMEAERFTALLSRVEGEVHYPERRPAAPE